MTTMLAIAGFAALFAVFGAFHLGRRRSCEDCSCTGDECQLDEEGTQGVHHS